MNIDLTRFVKSKEEIVPIVGGWGKKEGRKIEFQKQEDGWYKIKIGSNIEIISKATPLEIYKTLKDKKHYLVYSYGKEGIPVNFENFKKMGFEETIEVNFFNSPLYTISKVSLWEDNRFYFFENSGNNGLLGRAVREARGAGTKWGNIKGLTPELGYYLLLISLTDQAFREVDRLNGLVLSPKEKEKRVKQFANTLEGRLQKIIEDSGGKFIDYKKSRGDSLLVTWKVGGQVVKSQIKGDTFAIVSAGYCLSGDDKSHTMNSIVRLAKDFQEESPLYITRE